MTVRKIQFSEGGQMVTIHKLLQQEVLISLNHFKKKKEKSPTFCNKQVDEKTETR